jgi:hypothetical protein
VQTHISETAASCIVTVNDTARAAEVFRHLEN